MEKTSDFVMFNWASPCFRLQAEIPLADTLEPLVRRPETTGAGLGEVHLVDVAFLVCQSETREYSFTFDRKSPFHVIIF